MMMHFVYIVTYLGKMFVIEREISSLMITWLCMLKKNVVNSINNEASYHTTISKYEKLIE